MQVSWQFGVIKYLRNLFSYLLQINLCLWSKSPPIPKYILLPVFLDRKFLCPLFFGNVSLFLAHLRRRPRSPFHEYLLSLRFPSLTLLVYRLEGTWPFCTEETEQRVDYAEVHFAFMMVLFWYKYHIHLGWNAMGRAEKLLMGFIVT